MIERTIFALSSGNLPSGVAVVRLSGSETRFALETLVGTLPIPRKATLSNITAIDGSEVLDVGIVLWFPGPASFTGEDSAELHLHGSVAVVETVLENLSSIEGLYPAEPGEFSRRAFENDKLDLVELEGLADLVSAQTDAQRKQALGHVRGRLSLQLNTWRSELIQLRALIEAELDFSDEEDVPGSVAGQVWTRADDLSKEMRTLIKNSNAGAMIRDGFKVAIMGRPNTGKSSLLNTLAKDDVAIVTAHAGTTRDVNSTELNIDGFLVRVTDTAGLRATEDEVELEGIRRAQIAGEESDLILWLEDSNFDSDPEQIKPPGAITVKSKDDDGAFSQLSVSAKTGYGVSELLSLIRKRMAAQGVYSGDVVLSRIRQLKNVQLAVAELKYAVEKEEEMLDIRAEALRRAGDLIGRVTGYIDVEDLLDVIFSEFCIGK